MKLIDKISNSIISAMKEKNASELESLRAIKSALLLAQTQKGSEGNVGQSEEVKILQKLVKQRKESAEIYNKQNRLELADVEIRQSKIIERFLPAQISVEDLEKIIIEIINQTEAEGMKDMGKVMGIASTKLSGKADGKTISCLLYTSPSPRD